MGEHAPESIPKRDQMSAKNQRLYEEFQEMARPLHEKIAKQVDELNNIIRQKWEIEGQLERCAKSVKALVSERDRLRNVVDASRVVAETTTPFPVYGMGNLRDAVEALAAWEKTR